MTSNKERLTEQEWLTRLGKHMADRIETEQILESRIKELEHKLKAGQLAKRVKELEMTMAMIIMISISTGITLLITKLF